MAKRRGANKENYEETQSVFLALGRLEFATHGYAKASTNRIVGQCGMARGSLYYHFKDKEDLFRAIFTRLTSESNAEIKSRIEQIEDPWEALQHAANLFLTHALDPVFRRIVLIEALVAIPYLERMSITGENYSVTLATLIQRCVAAGYLPSDLPLRPLSLMIYSVMAEYGRALEYEANPETAKDGLLKLFSWMLERMRVPAGKA